jgi:chromosome partitioning protein
MQVVAIVNNKGGAGKTTTTRLPALSLADLGYSVGMLDIDDQANLSKAFNLVSAAPSMADVLRRRQPEPLLCAHHRAGYRLSLAPAGSELGDIADDLVVSQFGVLRLRTAIEDYRQSRQKPDWLLIDCPPNLASLTYSALIAADHLIIPTQCAEWSVSGIERVCSKIQSTDGVNYVRSQLGSRGLPILGVIACLYDQRVGDQARILAQLQAGDLTFLGIIPRREGADAELALRAAYEPVAQKIANLVGV